jgi:hypothetical protein
VQLGHIFAGSPSPTEDNQPGLPIAAPLPEGAQDVLADGDVGVPTPRTGSRKDSLRDGLISLAREADRQSVTLQHGVSAVKGALSNSGVAKVDKKSGELHVRKLGVAKAALRPTKTIRKAVDGAALGDHLRAVREHTASLPRSDEQTDERIPIGVEGGVGSHANPFPDAQSAKSTSQVPPQLPPAGWFPDPVGIFQYRYWNGQQWTDNVSSNGVSTLHQIGTPPSPSGPANSTVDVAHDDHYGSDANIQSMSDPSPNDAEWLSAGESRYHQLISSHYGSPDTIAAGGDERMAQDDPASGLFFYQKSIDTLHSIYVCNFNDAGPGSWSRQPSGHDNTILDRYVYTLRTVRQRRPAAPVRASVIEVTHRLRTIASRFEMYGLDPSHYLRTLSALGDIAPDVDVSGVFWS